MSIGKSQIYYFAALNIKQFYVDSHMPKLFWTTNMKKPGEKIEV
jgi:hypothetical protein